MGAARRGALGNSVKLDGPSRGRGGGGGGKGLGQAGATRTGEGREGRRLSGAITLVRHVAGADK